MAETLSATGLSGFRDVAARAVADGHVPGIVALVARGEEAHVEALGALALDGPPVLRNSLFRIASITKPIAGAATMALVDEGILRLDQPVRELLPELAAPRVLRRMDGPLDDTVPALRDITVRDLLTFTFGFGQVMAMFEASDAWPIFTAANELELHTFGPPNPAGPPDPDVWIARLGTLPLMAQPGERWLYNTSAAVLGVVLARAAEMPLADVLRTRLFEPLGMRDTAFFAADTTRLATAYQPTDDGFGVWDEPDGQWAAPPRFPDAGAGLVSTADDLLAFARMLLRGGGPVLSANAVSEMTRNQLTPAQLSGSDAILDGDGWGFCQSVVTSGPRAGAYGWTGGLGTSWLVDPHRDLTVIVLTQRLFQGPLDIQVHRDLQDAAYAALD